VPLLQIGIVGELAADSFVREDVRKALAQPAAARIQVAKRDGSKDIIEFLPLSDSLSLVKVNEHVSFTAYNRAAKALEDALAGLQTVRR
jgi:hypothetical protein